MDMYNPVCCIHNTCMNICDRICENVHSSHIQIFNFGDSENLLRMFNRCETFRDCRTIIPLSSLKISSLCIIHCGFYGSLNTQNRMCELCTFPKSGHICACACIYGNISYMQRLTVAVPLPNSSRMTRDLSVLSRKASDICRHKQL